MKAFIDTNVWIDFILERAPYYEAAACLSSDACYPSAAARFLFDEQLDGVGGQ